MAYSQQLYFVLQDVRATKRAEIACLMAPTKVYWDNCDTLIVIRRQLLEEEPAPLLFERLQSKAQ